MTPVMLELYVSVTSDMQPFIYLFFSVAYLVLSF